jgi:hypothetical protein
MREWSIWFMAFVAFEVWALFGMLSVPIVLACSIVAVTIFVLVAIHLLWVAPRVRVKCTVCGTGYTPEERRAAMKAETPKQASNRVQMYAVLYRDVNISVCEVDVALDPDHVGDRLRTCYFRAQVAGARWPLAFGDGPLTLDKAQLFDNIPAALEEANARLKKWIESLSTASRDITLLQEATKRLEWEPMNVWQRLRKPEL